MEQEKPTNTITENSVSKPTEKPQDKTWPEPEFMKFPIPDDIDTSEMTKKQIRKLKKTLFWESKIPEMRAKQRQNLKIRR